MIKIKRILFILGLAIIMFCISNVSYGEEQTNKNTDYIYLSDISYNSEKSFAASGHSIKIDENDSNDIIRLKVNDKSTPFIKGITAWATSEIVYDLRDYDYDYFTSYIGVDISEQSNYFNGGAKFYIYTSEDGEDWKEVYSSEKLFGWSNAPFIKVDIKNANYLKLVADENQEYSGDWWSSWYDETVFANAKLIKEGYVENDADLEFIKQVSEYDEIINKNYGNEITGDYELTLLQRELVNNVGYDILQALAKYSDEYKETINWLLNDKETLKLYLVGGKPEGSYFNSIKVLSELYNTYKEDLENINKTKYGTTFGELYRKMMISLSLTESGNVYLWIDGKTHSDAITRYEIYKKLYLHEGIEEELIENKIFESLTIEEMRFVMNTIIDDEEILWLNDYVRNEKNGATGPYSYIRYTFDYNYNLDKYYDKENYQMWDEKYNLSKYNITYEKGQPKLWIVFEEGAVCGGISKTGSCIWGAYKGLPNTCVSQPGHCAYIYYTQDANGNGIWNLGNDISGWGQSGRTEHLNVRTMNDWGNGSYTSGWNASYILLAQAAQNEYDKYEKAEKTLMLANIYSDDKTKLEEIYKKAIEEENINFDAWLGLVNLYINDNTKTDEDYYSLAKEIAETFTYYPRPMYDLLNLIKPHIKSVEYSAAYSLLQTRTLTTATEATENESIQFNAVRQVANALLGNIDTSIASFSFDGENANKIVLSSRFDGVDVAWDYSLDGGKTWTLSEEHVLSLTEEQIKSITAESDIKVHIMGVDYSEDNVYTIDIQESAGLPSNLYANDLENKLIGVNSAVEWKYEEDDEWTSYSKKEPDLNGDKNIIVRMGATGIYLADNETTTYNFTNNNEEDTKRYIPISNLSIFKVSSEEPGHNAQAQNAIDGNINTIWHSNWNGNDSERYIILKLNNPVYLSALQYVPRQSGSNGRIKNGQVLVSMDGETWTEAATISNWANSAEAKTVEFEEPIKAQYVKLVATDNYGDGRNFITASMINLFEDVTKKAAPTAEVIYNINNITNSDVTAKLVNESTKITITNNDGKDTYVFKENGEFTFEFIDENGNKGSALASVNWIDKIPPTATITYDITEETDKSVTATLSGLSEKVTIINNSGSDKYIFNDNGEFTFEFVDEAGNTGKATATVNWINKKSDEQNPDDENKPEEGQNPDGEDKPEEGQNPDGEDKPEEGQKPDGENKPEEEKPDDEDELKEEENKDEENNKLNDIEKDDTVANGKLPQTGTNNLVIYILLGITIIAIIFYIKMKKISKKGKKI